MPSSSWLRPFSKRLGSVIVSTISSQASRVSLAAATLGATVLCLSGLIVGWRIHSDLPHAVAGFGLLVLFAFTMLVVGTLLGLLVRSPDAAQGVVFIAVFQLTFVANTFVPVDGLPSVLRAIASYSPISAFAAAFRTLFGNPLALPAHPS
jgi:ABC-2 type transport system permease protein